MKLRILSGLTTIISVSVLLNTGCVNDDLKKMEEREQEIINRYLNENNISPETKTEGGIYYIEEIAGAGLSPVRDNYIVISYVGRNLEDGTIRETNYDSLKDEWSISSQLENFLYGPSYILYGYSMPGINEAFSLMKEGGKATVILPSDKANYDYRPLVYELELIKVIRDIERYSDSVLNIYSSKYYTAEEQMDTLGIWTKVLAAPASSNLFESGDTMYFNFTGRLIDGFGDSVVADRVFDSNTGLDPVRYVFGQTRLARGSMFNQNNLTKGLKQAVDSLDITNGMKFSVLLKHDQAFGKAGLLHPTDKYIMMPAYQNVEYTIEVTAIRPE